MAYLGFVSTFALGVIVGRIWANWQTDKEVGDLLKQYPLDRNAGQKLRQPPNQP